MGNTLANLAGLLFFFQGGDPALVKQLTLPNGLPMSHYQLENGLKVYVVENHAAPVFTYQAWVDVGSGDEKLDEKLNATGLAHLFEHMMFRGTPKYPDGEFDDVLTRNGVHDENATTWFDRTNYYESMPADKLDLVMELEADRLVNLVVDEDLLTTEKGAVVGELRMGLDDPDTVGHDALYAAAFTAHPYRYSTIGTEPEVTGFTVEQSNYFYKKYYQPQNVTLLLVGDLDPEKVAASARKFYGDIKSEPVKKPIRPSEPAQAAERKATIEHAQLIERKVFLGYHTPAAAHADIPALWVAEAMLTTGQGSLLQQAWVNDGIASQMSGTLDLFRDPGLLTLGADLQSGKTAAHLAASLEAVLVKIQDKSFPLSAQVTRARNQLLLAIYEQWDENAALANFMGEFIATSGDPVKAFDLAAAVSRVTPAEVVRVVGQYLVPTNRTVIEMTPKADLLGGK
ncbi:MAG: M16 family metallopeptidase [Bacteriovoracia bacterium]